MKRFGACVLVGFGCLAGAAHAQGRVDSTDQGGPPVVSKPAPSRFYGTARPPGAPGAPPSAAPVAPPSARPPGTGAPPGAYAPGARPNGPAHPTGRPPASGYSGSRYSGGYGTGSYHAPAPRVGVDIVVGTGWPRPPHPAHPVYPAYPYWYGPRYYGPRYYPYPYYGYPPAVVIPPPVVVSPPPPVVYVERQPEPSAPVPGYWYWCAEPQGWYPSVDECPGGWQPVPPRVGQ